MNSNLMQNMSPFFSKGFWVKKFPFLKDFFAFLQKHSLFFILCFLTIIFLLCYFESLRWPFPGPKATHGIAKGLAIILAIFLFFDKKFKGYKTHTHSYMVFFFVSYVVSTAFSLDIDTSLLHLWYPFISTLVIFLFSRVKVSKAYLNIVIALSMLLIFVTFAFSFFSIVFRYSVDNLYYFIFLDHRANYMLDEIRKYGKYASLGPYIMLAPLAASFLVEKSSSLTRKILSFFMILITLLTAVISNNRIDVLVFAIHAAIYSFLFTKKQIVTFTLPVVGVTLLGLFMTQLYFGFNLEQRILRPAVERDQETVSMRFTYWDTALTNFRNFPLFGTGPNTYNVVSDFPLRRYYVRGVREYTVNPDEGIGIHNIFIERLADTGIFGFSTFVLVLFWFGKQDWKACFFLKNQGNQEGMKKYILFSLSSWTWILYGVTDNGYGAQGFVTFFFLRGLLPHVFEIAVAENSVKKREKKKLSKIQM